MRASKDTIVDAFFQSTAKKFAFLIINFGFDEPLKRNDAGTYRLLYKNGTTGVEIGLEWREQYLYLELFRLVNGEIRDNPIIIDRKSKLTNFNFEDLLTIRPPKTHVAHRDTTPLTLSSLNRVVAHYSELLPQGCRGYPKRRLHGFPKTRSHREEQTARNRRNPPKRKDNRKTQASAVGQSLSFSETARRFRVHPLGSLHTLHDVPFTTAIGSPPDQWALLRNH